MISQVSRFSDILNLELADIWFSGKISKILKTPNFSLIRHISVIFKNCIFHHDIQKEIELAKFSIQALISNRILCKIAKIALHNLQK